MDAGQVHDTVCLLGKPKGLKYSEETKRHSLYKSGKVMWEQSTVVHDWVEELVNIALLTCRRWRHGALLPVCFIYHILTCKKKCWVFSWLLYSLFPGSLKNNLDSLDKVGPSRWRKHKIFLSYRNNIFPSMKWEEPWIRVQECPRQQQIPSYVSLVISICQATVV